MCGSLLVHSVNKLGTMYIIISVFFKNTQTDNSQPSCIIAKLLIANMQLSFIHDFNGDEENLNDALYYDMFKYYP